VFLPYRKKRVRGYEWGDLFAVAGSRHLHFANPS
jgi:hypothetical protein